MEGITIIEYIAHNNPEALNDVIVYYGMDSAYDVPDLIQQTNDLFMENPAQIQDELLNIHPDKDAIINFYLKYNNVLNATIPTKALASKPETVNKNLLVVGVGAVAVFALYNLLK